MPSSLNVLSGRADRLAGRHGRTQDGRAALSVCCACFVCAAAWTTHSTIAAAISFLGSRAPKVAPNGTKKLQNDSREAQNVALDRARPKYPNFFNSGSDLDIILVASSATLATKKRTSKRERNLAFLDYFPALPGRPDIAFHTSLTNRNACPPIHQKHSVKLLTGDSTLSKMTPSRITA